MKLKYKGLISVSVFCKGKFYNFINGTIEVSDEEAKELLKNTNVEKFEVIAEETVEEVSNKTDEEKLKTGKKGNK